MSELVRFGVSMDQALLERFDRLKRKGIHENNGF